MNGIVILGGGFAGLYTARHLERLSRGRADISITLISRDNYFLMTPLLFEAGSGVLEPRHTVNPIRPLLQKTRFMEAEVANVDLEQRRVNVRLVGKQPGEVKYDHLVLALGGITNTTLVPGSDQGRTFKTLADAMALRNHVIELFERADIEPDQATKRTLLTFVIVGAGLVGVELQGELTEFTKHVLRTYRNVKPQELRFELLEAGKRIMPEIDEKLADHATNLFRSRGVNVRTGVAVESIEPQRVHLPGGETIESHTIIVATGVLPSPIVAALPIEKDKRGRAMVESTMRAKGRDELWALGDCASIPDPRDPGGRPYPQLAQHALREAKVLAKNILAAIDGKPLAPFIYNNKGTLAALGGFEGVGRVFVFKVKGFVAWWVWRTYYLFQMPQWSRRLRIVIDWTVALFFKNDIVELQMDSRRHLPDEIASNDRTG